MNNETTASQPKSIGDDAQFLQLLTAVETAPRYSKELSEASAALITAIDSKLRAPAAQASATIQAAPEGILTADDEKLLRNIGDQPYGEDDHGRGRTLSIMAADVIRRLAATIQEPVMVAEPVTHELMQHLGTMRAVFHTNMLRAYPEKSHAEIAAEIDRALGAAPMVADPAGTAGFAELRTGLKKLNRTVDCEHLIHQLDALAATVKAVPSEALDEVLRAKFEAEARANWPIGFERNHFGAFSSSSVERDYQTWKIAAPLADKTGGGE